MIAFVAGVLLASAPPAFAQGHKGSAIGGTGPTDDPAKKKKRDDEEKAAKAAMERVPDSKAKYDPWKIER
ncbi:MAG: hypothetical protein EKK40_15425 [Bradyrhizobiaceae bacterium]|nr:MAG: hypothetical protein EKK40_15425 [Bradyrhizobiaceae bacterium]